MEPRWRCEGFNGCGAASPKVNYGLYGEEYHSIRIQKLIMLRLSEEREPILIPSFSRSYSGTANVDCMWSSETTLRLCHRCFEWWWITIFTDFHSEVGWHCSQQWRRLITQLYILSVWTTTELLIDGTWHYQHVLSSFWIVYPHPIPRTLRYELVIYDSIMISVV